MHDVMRGQESTDPLRYNEALATKAASWDVNWARDRKELSLIVYFVPVHKSSDCFAAH
jgi:hypothetical protein